MATRKPRFDYLVAAIALEGVYQLTMFRCAVKWSRQAFFAKGSRIVTEMAEHQKIAE